FSPVLLFFNHIATTDIYTLSLHDALPILSLIPFFVQIVFDKRRTFINSRNQHIQICIRAFLNVRRTVYFVWQTVIYQSFNKPVRSEEHTSELQSRENLVCRLLLEKKKTII